MTTKHSQDSTETEGERNQNRSVLDEPSRSSHSQKIIDPGSTLSDLSSASVDKTVGLAFLPLPEQSWINQRCSEPTKPRRHVKHTTRHAVHLLDVEAVRARQVGPRGPPKKLAANA